MGTLVCIDIPQRVAGAPPAAAAAIPAAIPAAVAAASWLSGQRVMQNVSSFSARSSSIYVASPPPNRYDFHSRRYLLQLSHGFLNLYCLGLLDSTLNSILGFCLAGIAKVKGHFNSEAQPKVKVGDCSGDDHDKYVIVVKGETETGASNSFNIGLHRYPPYPPSGGGHLDRQHRRCRSRPSTSR